MTETEKKCREHLYDYFDDYLLSDIKKYGKVFYNKLVEENSYHAEAYIIKDYLLGALDKDIMRNHLKGKEIENCRNYTLTVAKGRLQDYIRKWDKKNRIVINSFSSYEECDYSDVASKIEDMSFVEVMEILNGCLDIRQKHIVFGRLSGDSNEALGELLGIKAETVRKIYNESYSIVKEELYGCEHISSAKKNRIKELIA